MIFFMGSKVFQDYYLVNEPDDAILAAHYVVVSNRIMRRDKSDIDNIVIATSYFMPTGEIWATPSKKDRKTLYMKFIDTKSKLTLATMILGSINKGYNIIFICTDSERKLKLFEYLAEYVYVTFGYPMYNYKSYCTGMCELIKYNKKKVEKRCNKLLNTEQKRVIDKILSYEIHNEFEENKLRTLLKKRKKKLLKKVLQSCDYYDEGLSKSEMIDRIITVL